MVSQNTWFKTSCQYTVTVKLLLDGELSNFIFVQVRVHQSSGLSPLLFAILMDAPTESEVWFQRVSQLGKKFCVLHELEKKKNAAGGLGTLWAPQWVSKGLAFSMYYSLLKIIKLKLYLIKHCYCKKICTVKFLVLLMFRRKQR